MTCRTGTKNFRQRPEHSVPRSERQTTNNKQTTGKARTASPVYHFTSCACRLISRRRPQEGRQTEGLLPSQGERHRNGAERCGRFLRQEGILYPLIDPGNPSHIPPWNATELTPWAKTRPKIRYLVRLLKANRKIPLNTNADIPKLPVAHPPLLPFPLSSG